VQFSVIIPTRNRPQFLAEAIESVLAQQGVSFEILIVNDGDKATPHFSDRRVKVLDNHRQGPVAARKFGVSLAAGDNIAFLDDDDYWIRNDFLSRALQHLSSGSDFVFADGRMVFHDGRPDVDFAFDADATSLETDNSILISSVCYARLLHMKLGGFDESLPYYWDWDWYLRVARSGAKLQRLAQASVAIRVHSSNMSGESGENARRKNLDAFTRKHGLKPIKLKNHLSLALE
jgi:glycosyltransferase involved in cell wall biosynthesis